MNSGSFSRHQFSICFDEKVQNWYVVDGDEEKKSLNGTWLRSKKVVGEQALQNNRELSV